MTPSLLWSGAAIVRNLSGCREFGRLTLTPSPKRELFVSSHVDGGLLVLQVDGGGPSPKRELFVSSHVDGGLLSSHLTYLTLTTSPAGGMMAAMAALYFKKIER